MDEKIGYVYLTTNLVNGKQYVGQHLHDGFDKYYKGSGHAIKAAFDKYGWDNFKCEVLQWCTTQTQLNEVEDNYIKLLGTMSPNGYNLRGGGSNGKMSNEARKKASEVHKKYFESEEGIKARKKLSEAHKKYYESEENRKKNIEAQNKYWKEDGVAKRKNASDRMKKYYESEEGIKTRKKISDALVGRIGCMKDKHHTEETKNKIGEANKGKKRTDETRKKISESLKKFCNSEYGKKTREKQKKRILQYTLDGAFVKEWDSLSEVRRVLGFDISSISNCCKGKPHYKSAYDYIWRYK